MNEDRLRALLAAVAAGDRTPEDALEQLRGFPGDDLGFAVLDTHRALRQGMIEAVYAAGKTADQVAALLQRSLERHGAALATRVPEAMAPVVLDRVPGLTWSPVARVLWHRDETRPEGPPVAVVAAGTSDLPVLEEAALTLTVLGERVDRVVDVGVAGLHRLLPHLPVLRAARAIVVVAGMEGALPSVIGGLVDRPVIAVPTSVGYGAHLQGLTPLLAMLTSCASGIAVVNIDNGFGAACAAHRIVRSAGPGPGPGESP